MKLADLLTPDAVSDPRFAALDITGISADSRALKPGDLFVAVAGAKDDGLRFVPAALAAGAAAVMAERVPATVLPDGVAFVMVGDARRALFARLVVDHRLNARDPFVPMTGGIEAAVASHLLGDAPAGMAAVGALLTAA